jgi:hypothetical protein
MTALDRRPSISSGQHRGRSLARLALLGVETLIGGAAAVCGPLLILTDGLGMDRVQLQGTPFDRFIVPGVVLGLVVGGSLLGAAWMVWRDRRHAALASVAAGGVLLGWIAVEAVMIHAGRGLQAFIALSALAIFALAVRLRAFERIGRYAQPSP